jgi:hypothetical protein
MTSINKLPSEMVQHIFYWNGNSIQERVLGLCKMQLVCKTWNELASSDLLWGPLLNEISPRRYKKLSEAAESSTSSIKSIFATVVVRANAQLNNCLNFIQNEALSDAYKGNALQNFSLIRNDATDFFEHLIEKQMFEDVLSFLLKGVLFDHNRVFKKLLMVDMQKILISEKSYLYFLVLQFLLRSKKDFSAVFTELEDQQSDKLGKMMALICCFQNESVLSFVECGLDPNFMISGQIFSHTQKKFPVIRHFIQICFSAPRRSQRKYEERLRFKETIDIKTRKTIERIEKYYSIEFPPIPLTLENLLKDFELFLKLKELDINARNIEDNTVLFEVRRLMPLSPTHRDCLNQIETLLVANGAII